MDLWFKKMFKWKHMYKYAFYKEMITPLLCSYVIETVVIKNSLNTFCRHDFREPDNWVCRVSFINTLMS